MEQDCCSGWEWCLMKTPIRRLLEMKAIVPTPPQPTEYTETGNPLSFETNVRRNLTECLVSFAPVQSGSGDPSPENIRPITGWDGVSVTQNGTVYPVTWTEKGTMYGGTVDLATGILTVTHRSNTFTGAEGESWSKDGSRFLIKESGAKCKSNSRSSVLSNIGKYASSGSALYTVFMYGVGGQNPHIYYCPSTDITTVDDFKTWLSSNNLQIVYELAESVEVQLTPVQIMTMIGTNTLSTDGDSLTVKYLKR